MNTVVGIVLNADGKFPHAKQLDNITAIGLLPNGTAGGKSAVMVEITLADGSKIYGQTTLALLDTAVNMFNVRDDLVSSGHLQE